MSGHSEDNPSGRIRVKFVGTYGEDIWRRQFPGGEPRWGRCDFILDAQAQDYDWLVVYNDLPRRAQRETLSGAAENTLLVTTEPPSIKAYGNDFTAQFGHVLTSQPAWALPHPHRIYSQPALQWYYGKMLDEPLAFDRMAAFAPTEKTRMLSTMCSNKRQRHTLHRRRYDFTHALKAEIPELEIFGLGVRPVQDKTEALDAYRYHLVIENYFGPHHWTEKLADAFLGASLPFYAGCPNAEDYFPAESLIRIDIRDVRGSAEIIRQAMRDGEYARRLPQILEARQRVLERYNLFAVLAREIEQRHFEPGRRGEVLLSRRLLRKRHPAVALRHVWEKLRIRALYALYSRR